MTDREKRDFGPIIGVVVLAVLSPALTTVQAQLFEQKLSAIDAAGGDRFGGSVSISGDTAVVGVPADDEGCAMNSDCNTGSALVFVRSTGVWSQQARLTASDAGAADSFGHSVAISGDVVIVGADSDDHGGKSNAGSAYVFVKPAGGWTNTTQTAKLTASDANDNDRFGHSVSISGNTAVAGAYLDDDVGSATGSAYVFVMPAGGWSNMTQTAKLRASDAVAGERLGLSVSISEDTVLAGAPTDDDAGNCSGSAYVFIKPATGWIDVTEAAKLTASDAAADHEFGTSVSISGETAVVGAYLQDGVGMNTGAAYVFKMPEGGWVNANENARLTASDAATDDRLGESVSINGGNVIAGASDDDDAGSESGSAYIFQMPAGGWADMTESSKVTAPDGATADDFGIAVAISGDTAVVGAEFDDDAGSASGSAYVFRTDRDGDGLADADDGCPEDAAKAGPGVCGCGVPDTDTDGDGVADCVDVCPALDDNADTDGDGISDCLIQLGLIPGSGGQPIGCCAPGAFPIVGFVLPVCMLAMRSRRIGHLRARAFI